LADYQAARADLTAEGIELAAASTQDQDKTLDFSQKLGLGFPVAWGLDAEETSRLTGAYYDADRRFLHAAGFLLLADGRLETASISSGAIGRLSPREVLLWVRHLKKQAAASRQA